MIKRWDFRALMPADDVYIGSAKVSFRTPDGEVSGPCKVEVHSDGHVNIGVEIEQSRIPDEYHGYLMPFLSGEIPKVTGKNTIFRPGGTQQITNVEATTQQGIFRGARAIISNSNFGLLSPE